MKIKINRPVVDIEEPKKESTVRYKVFVRNVTLASILWFFYRHGVGSTQKLKIECSNFLEDINDTDFDKFYIPKLDSLIKDYLLTLRRIMKVLSDCKDLDKNFLFGLMPINTLLSCTFYVDSWLVTIPANRWDNQNFPKLNDRYEFPMSDYGYLEIAFEKAKIPFIKKFN